MKKSRQTYYDKYFERNWNNIKEHMERNQMPYFSKNCSIPCTYRTVP